jgi:hypothetical protein
MSGKDLARKRLNSSSRKHSGPRAVTCGDAVRNTYSHAYLIAHATWNRLIDYGANADHRAAKRC